MSLTAGGLYANVQGRGATRKNLLILGAVGIVFVLPFVEGSPFRLFQFDSILILAITTIGLNLAFGYAGEYFLFQPAILAVSAYATAVLTTEEHWNLWLVLPVALVLGTVGGVVAGSPGLRVKGLYLGLLSFFALLVIGDLPLVWQGVLGGSTGLLEVPAIGGGGTFLFEAILAGLILMTLATWNLVRSSWGMRFRALRDAPGALVTVGLAEGRTRLFAYGVSSFVGALAGWFFAQANAAVLPTMFSLNLILVVFASVIVGGRGTLVGPILGAIVLEGYTEFVGQFSAYNVMGLGALLFIAILVAPEGIVSAWHVWSQNLRWPRRPDPKHPPSESQTMTGGETASKEGAGASRVLLGNLPSPIVSEARDISRSAAAREDTSNRAPSLEHEHLLEVVGLRKSFGSVEALQGIDLTISPGQIVGLLGANGSGKTTLVNVVTGLLTADSAQIYLAGKDVAGLSAPRRAAAGIVRTFQVPQLVEDVSARSNIELGAVLRFQDPLLAAVGRLRGCRVRARKRKEIAMQICSQLGISEEIQETKAKYLSLGMRRVIEVGRAMATGADVICLDEPAAGLETEDLPQLGAVLRGLAQSGRGVLLIEHNVGFIMAVADTVLLLEHGVVVERSDHVNGEFRHPPAISEYIREVPL